MLTRALVAAACACLTACGLPPRTPAVSLLDAAAPERRLPMVRAPLLPFELVELGEPSRTIGLPIVPGGPGWRSPRTGDLLADTGQHLRVDLVLEAGGAVRIEEVAVGDGTARAYLSEADDLVVNLLGPEDSVLATARLRQPGVQHVYRRTPATAEGGLRMAPTHGTRQLASVAFPVFLPADPRATHVEVRMGSNPARVVARYALR